MEALIVQFGAVAAALLCKATAARAEDSLSSDRGSDKNDSSTDTTVTPTDTPVPITTTTVAPNNTDDGSPDSSSPSGFLGFLMFLFNVGLVFGPHIGYIVQFFEIQSTNSIDGYSPIVSVILLVSNTVRIFYYPGSMYAKALLLQSIMAVLTHCLLLHKVLSVHREQVREETENRVLDYLSGVNTTQEAAARRAGSAGAAKAGEDPMMAAGTQPAAAVDTSSSYNIDLNVAVGGYGALPDDPNDNIYGDDGGSGSSAWSRFIGTLNGVCDVVEDRLKSLDPVQFLFMYAAAAAFGFFFVLMLYAITHFAVGFVEFVGYLALGIEATFVIPQILRNARRKSTEGLTVVLIVMWVGGDIVKIIYFGVTHQPLPFLLCGGFQLALDFVVVYQFFFYRWRSAQMDNMFPSVGEEGHGRGETPYVTAPSTL